MDGLATSLVPTVAELQQMRRVARGDEPADLILRGGTVAAMHSLELLPRDVVISGRYIAAVTPIGRFAAHAEVDALGLTVFPTFIDTHIHIEYTMLTPGELARLVIPKGTTTLLADPNCIAAVLGPRGMDFMGRTGTPLRIFQQVSPKIPSFPGLELAGAVIPQQVTLERLHRENAVTLGESTPYSVDDEAAERYVTTLKAGRRITGHTARLSDEPLWAFLAAGVGDDHNAVTTDEVLERVRLGAMITVMAGSMNDNVPFVFADLDRVRGSFGHLSFCADDKHVEDLADFGHIDHHVRQAIELGVDPIWAYRMGTLNAASYYRLDHLIGSVTPSRLADLQLVRDVAAVRPDSVLVDGKVVAEQGEARFTNDDLVPDWTRGTINVDPGISAEAFAVHADGGQEWVQAVEMYDGYFKRAFHAQLQVRDGAVVPDTERDILKIAVVDRHHASRTIGVGFVHGFGLTSGALAASTNCTNQNLVVLGTSDVEMAHAVRALVDVDGGYVAVAGGKVLGTVPLAIAGNMSDRPWEVVNAESHAINAVAASLGCRIQAPFMIMSFVGLAGVPDFGLTELGLIETATQTFAPVVLATDIDTVCCRCPNHSHRVHATMDPASASVS